MNLKPSKILSIYGVPRSGTSWLGQIIDSSPAVTYKYQPLFSNSFKDRINVRSTREEIIQFFNELFEYEDDFLDRVKEKQKGIYPIFKVQNNNPDTLAFKMVRYLYLIPRFLAEFDEIKILAIVRHPCGHLSSWKNNPMEFMEEWNFEDVWRFGQSKNEYKPEEYFGFHKWQEATKMFLEMKDRYPDKFYLVKYEDLFKDPVNESKKIYEFCKLEFHRQTNDFIAESLSKYEDHPSSVFKANKKVDDWKENLEQKIIDKVLNELKGTEFEQFL
ncbi:MAG: sulfotransferase [Bacteroidetes bacterium]|nr:sulfotransferase [Bacteroidota bacterium]